MSAASRFVHVQNGNEISKVLANKPCSILLVTLHAKPCCRDVFRFPRNRPPRWVASLRVGYADSILRSQSLAQEWRVLATAHGETSGAAETMRLTV